MFGTENQEIEQYNTSVDINKLPMFTRPELAAYDGSHKPEIYLAIRGFVYDVTSNPKNYGPGKSYHKLVGRDVTRLLGLNKLVIRKDGDEAVDTWSTDDFSDKQHQAVDKWIQFFRKRYRVVGLVVGHDP
ncbi:cytochrome b5 [Yamadazyma tenuis ATCC 10573]|uniref:Cytochrome b5 n=1 Tax=Candida tenuis (strain ATCC 10573 / BCRC 21748 / CBS 615 / JCM 9827 / NBRC 10315 / NRRL Y-1498 / VKM Y-70) TaxID=590646 RepID=G3BAS5_CANTC|nr:cytochrome b5 [Yamadazyma tenuis ATCC 10573]EGV62099.1 cytochrome b5 [Yamadazyma tenuis ATCC 10573]